jgi:hypothetical protein
MRNLNNKEEEVMNEKENKIMNDLKNRIIALEEENRRLQSELEFSIERERRIKWLFCLVGGPAFVTKDEEIID